MSHDHRHGDPGGRDIDDEPTEITGDEREPPAPPQVRWPQTILMQATPMPEAIPSDPATLPVAIHGPGGLDEWSVDLPPPPPSNPSADWVARASDAEIERSIEKLRREEGIDHVLPPANQLLIEPVPESQPTRLLESHAPVAAYPAVSIGVPMRPPAAGAPAPQHAIPPQPPMTQQTQQPMGASPIAPPAALTNLSRTLPIGHPPFPADPVTPPAMDQPPPQPARLPPLEPLQPRPLRPRGSSAPWIAIGFLLFLVVAAVAGMVALRRFHFGF